ncbi:MAG: DUF3179 domain-containing protein [Candidatus Latescibacteria bacterium]|nr:DUF3179 domain-containing protein [Candidatus Latescibacterota bacterium]
MRFSLLRPLRTALLLLGALANSVPAQPDRDDTELAQVAAWVRTRAYDKIPAIDRPRFTSADQAAFLRDTDQVVGVYRNGQAKAYPVQFLNGREVVNDSLAGGPITVTW